MTTVENCLILGTKYHVNFRSFLRYGAGHFWAGVTTGDIFTPEYTITDHVTNVQIIAFMTLLNCIFNFFTPNY